jgi:exonuclease III
MLLLSWNVAGRLKRMGEQADVVIGLGADVVCLQELTPATARPWGERLGAAGYEVAAAAMPRVRDSSRPLGVLVAARSPLSPAAVEDVPWWCRRRQRWRSAAICTSGGASWGCRTIRR